MSEPYSGAIQRKLDFFILNLVSNGPISRSVIEGMATAWIRTCDGEERQTMPDSLHTVLRRLERAGWLSVEVERHGRSHSEKIYYLTTAGTEQLERECGERLQAFLNRNGSERIN